VREWLQTLGPSEFLATAFGFAVLTTLALQLVGTAALFLFMGLLDAAGVKRGDSE